MKKTPQDFIVDSLTQMLTVLKNQDDYVGDMKKDEAYTYILKSFCDKYSNSFYDTEHERIFNMYHSSLRLCDIEHFGKTVFISKKAYEKIHDPNLKENFENYRSNSNTKNKSFGAYFHKELGLYFEHLTPMSQPRKRLVEISKSNETITKADVEECFKYSALALITKDESKSLDGENCFVTDIDWNTLTELKMNFPGLVDDFSIEYAEKLNDTNTEITKRRLRDNGNGLIRIVHMVNSGINFVDKNGNELQPEELVKRLNDFTFILDQFG
ncbi:MAG: hypothetical protein KBS59_06695 [Clostridiales bacterium]|nr:hypothetical protein [Clostridiales bacterium]